MKIVNVGCNYHHPKDFVINRPYGSGDFLLLVLKTKAFFILGGKKQTAQKNSVIIFKKGTMQQYGALDDKYINDWIHFEADDEDIIKISKLGIPFDTLLQINDTITISGFIKGMFNEKYSLNINKEESLNLYLRLIFLKISEYIKLPEATRENRYYYELSALRNEIYQNPMKSWNIEKICKELNLSRSYIQHMYKKFFGEAIISDVTNSRMEYAKHLLSGTDMTVSAISQMCGYSSDVHFMRIFKKLTSLTPTQFRTNTHVKKAEIESSKKSNPFCLEF